MTLRLRPRTTDLQTPELIILVYHHTQNNYRTELYYFRIIFGNSRSVITEPICFWN